MKIEKFSFSSRRWVKACYICHLWFEFICALLTLSGYCSGGRIGALMKCVIIWQNWLCFGYFRFLKRYFIWTCFVIATCPCDLLLFVKLSLYSLQAVWVWTVSLPVTIVNASSHNPSLQAADIIGWIIWSIGIVVEATADQQKLTFKNSQDNRGKWCDVGVWKYSRHPNYFGEVNWEVCLFYKGPIHVMLFLHVLVFNWQ